MIPQQEYIITEAELREEEAKLGIYPGSAKRIRSHPAPSPSAPNENQIRAKEIREEVHKIRQELHDAAIRNSESSRWAIALNTLIATESKRKSKDDVDMVYSYRVAQIIESLRTKEH